MLAFVSKISSLGTKIPDAALKLVQLLDERLTGPEQQIN